MARKSQADRINLLSQVVAELADKLAVLIAPLSEDMPDLLEEVRELRDLAFLCVDETRVSQMRSNIDAARTNNG